MVCTHDKKVREIIVNLVRDEGYTQTEAARIGGVERQTVRKYVRVFEETGDYFSDSESFTGRKTRGARASDAVVSEISAVVKHSPTLFRDEIAAEVYRATGDHISVTTLCRIIKRSNLTR